MKIFISGCFDIIHGGHIEFFKQAKSLGTELVVCIPSESVLLQYKGKRPSMPIRHKIEVLKSIRYINNVLIGNNPEIGLDFQDHFKKEKPDILCVTSDDIFREKKEKLCIETNCKYIVLEKELSFEKISTTEIIRRIQSNKKIPLRLALGGGWLDVPKLSIPGSHLVTCTINLFYKENENEFYQYGSGLGCSAARAIANGKDPYISEYKMGVGWQDPAAIQETGLCAWKSGNNPTLEVKMNPNFIDDRANIGLHWTGKEHNSKDIVNIKRDYDLIQLAGEQSYRGVINRNINLIISAIHTTYKAQLKEGMEPLPNFNEICKKYCGSGWGGYSMYLFNKSKDIIPKQMIKVNTYMYDNGNIKK